MSWTTGLWKLAWYVLASNHSEGRSDERSCQVVSREHILTAICQALQAASSQNLRTKTVHSEVLLALHPSNNVRSPPPPPSFTAHEPCIHRSRTPSSDSVSPRQRRPCYSSRSAARQAPTAPGRRSPRSTRTSSRWWIGCRSSSRGIWFPCKSYHVRRIGKLSRRSVLGYKVHFGWEADSGVFVAAL